MPVWCPFPDCFSCPHPDCIKDTQPKLPEGMRRLRSAYDQEPTTLCGLDDETRRKRRKAENAARYRAQHPDRVRESRRKWRQKEKERKLQDVQKHIFGGVTGQRSDPGTSS